MAALSSKRIICSAVTKGRDPTVWLDLSAASNSYTKHAWAGKSIWCNPPFDEVEEVLLQALAGAGMDPEKTNTLLVLPDWPDAAWWPKLTRSVYHYVGYYPTGSHLFTAAPRGQGQRRDMGPIRCGVIMAITGYHWLSLARSGAQGCISLGTTGPPLSPLQSALCLHLHNTQNLR